MRFLQKVSNTENVYAELALLLGEEGAEVTQAASKVQRFGAASRPPEREGAPSNQEHLADELGDVIALAMISIRAGLLDAARLRAAVQDKYRRVEKYLSPEAAAFLPRKGP